MNPLYAQMQCEQAMIEAVLEKRAFTVVGFEPDGELVACIDGECGRYWVTL